MSSIPSHPVPDPSEAGVPAGSPGSRARDAIAKRLDSQWLRGLAWPAAALALYLAVGAYLLWPVISDLGGTLFGANGDLTGGMAIWREIVDAGRIPFLPGTVDSLNAPDGLPIRWTLNVVAWPTATLLWLGTVAFGSVVAYTLYSVMALPLSGLAVFLLARRVTANPWAALVAGFAIAFYPFALVDAGGHADYVHAWVLVLPIWRLLVLAERPNRRNGLFAGAAVSFAMAWTPYFFLFAILMWAALALLGLAFAARDGRLRVSIGPHLIAAGVIVVTAGAMFSVNSFGPASEIRTLSKAELYAYSARPYEYVLPSYGPLARLTGSPQYLAEHMHGSNAAESTLYVGLSIIALALVGLIALVCGRLPKAEARAAIAMAVIVGVALAFSAPPTWDAWGLSLPMPSDAIFQVTSAWRVYSRLVVVVMIGLCVLAAIGIGVLVRGRTRPVQALMLAAISLLVVVDLAPQTSNFTPIEIPDLYRTLAAQPPGIVAQYPLVPSVYSVYNDIWYRAAGGHPTLNGYPSGSPQETRALGLSNLASPHTLVGLKALGVRYVLVSILPSAPSPPPGKPGPGYRLVARDWYGSLYRIAPGAESAIASIGEGFDTTEATPSGSRNWLLTPSGTIAVRGSCRSCRGTVTFSVASLGIPRVVTISLPGRGVVFRRRVTVPIDVSIPVAFDRSAALTLTAKPGPRPVASVIPGSKDPRSVSVAVGNVAFIQR